MKTWLDLTERSVRRDGWVIRRGHPEADWRAELPRSHDLWPRLMRAAGGGRFARRQDAKDFVDRFDPLEEGATTP